MRNRRTPTLHLVSWHRTLGAKCSTPSLRDTVSLASVRLGILLRCVEATAVRAVSCWGTYLSIRQDFQIFAPAGVVLSHVALDVGRFMQQCGKGQPYGACSTRPRSGSFQLHLNEANRGL
jgi:hypothetical protein